MPVGLVGGVCEGREGQVSAISRGSEERAEDGADDGDRFCPPKSALPVMGVVMAMGQLLGKFPFESEGERACGRDDADWRDRDIDWSFGISISILSGFWREKG